MDLLTGLNIGQQTLVTHATALDTVADNLANLNTPGFKSDRVDFADIFAESLGGLFGELLPTGNGVLSLGISTSHELQGSLDATGRPLDAAIEGNGFFVLNDGTNTFYTRAGNFTTDSLGNIVSVTAENLMGFTTASPTTLVPLTVNGIGTGGTASSTIGLQGNLDASSALTTVPGTSTGSALSTAASFQSSLTLIDSLGQRHEAGLFFFHTNASNWTLQIYADGAEVGGTAGQATLLGSGNISFDGAGSQGGSVNTVSISPSWSNGATAGQVSVDIGALTGFAESSSLRSISGDGSPAGNVVQVSINNDGNVVASLDTGDEVVVGQVALATFTATDELDKIGDNKFVETADSGAASVGTVETASRGAIVGEALENSNVDPSTEFVNLIKFQRGYQSGARVLSTFSDLYDKTLELLS